MVNNWEDFVNQNPPQQQRIMEELKRGIPNRPPVPPIPHMPDDDRAALYISREALEKANMAMADANVGMNKVREILTVVEDFLVKYEDLKMKLIDAKIEIDYLRDKVRSLSVWKGQTSTNSSAINTIENLIGIPDGNTGPILDRIAALEREVFPPETPELTD